MLVFVVFPMDLQSHRHARISSFYVVKLVQLSVKALIVQNCAVKDSVTCFVKMS